MTALEIHVVIEGLVRMVLTHTRASASLAIPEVTVKRVSYNADRYIKSRIEITHV